MVVEKRGDEWSGIIFNPTALDKLAVQLEMEPIAAGIFHDEEGKLRMVHSGTYGTEWHGEMPPAIAALIAKCDQIAAMLAEAVKISEIEARDGAKQRTQDREVQRDRAAAATINGTKRTYKKRTGV